MNCCVNCFTDQGLKSIVKMLSSKTGKCKFCLTEDVIVVRCEELSVYFEPLFNLYANHPNAEKSLGVSEPILLWEHLHKYWGNLFNNSAIEPKMIMHLIDQIGKGYENYTESLFEEPVEFQYLMGEEANLAGDLELKWSAFSREIKFENRFFLNEEMETKVLKPLLEKLGSTYPIGSTFFRARISDTKLHCNELGKPESRLASGGRANPVGIPYLYISDSEKTTIYETRISLHESISIGRFVLNESLSVLSLKNIAEYGPFEIINRDFEIDEFIKYRSYLLKLGSELSKPVRKQDSVFDYLPTQYLCEFIKYLKFDAVEYKSAMNPDGYNLAVFNDDKFECVESTFHKVTDLKYNWVEA